MSDPDINKLDKTIAVIEQKIDDGFKQNFKEHSEIFEYIKDIEAKKAGKWTEKVLIWAGTIVGGSLLIALMSLILNK